MTGDSPSSTGSLARRRPARGWLSAIAVVAVSATVAGGVGVLTATAADAATPHQVGTAPKVPQGAVRAGTPDGGTQLRLDVELAPRDKAGLAAFVQAVSDPKSAQYKHYLAKGQFASVFGPTKATIDSVTSALRAEGLNPGTPSADGLTIPVTATFAQASTAFGTSFANYRLKDGRTAFANVTAPSMSMASSVAGQVTGVVGLNNFVKPHAMHQTPNVVATHVAAGKLAHVSPNAVSPSICGPLQTALAQGDPANNIPPAFDTQNYWEAGTLSQSTAYNTNQLYGAYGDTGQNVTVGLFELEDFTTADVAAYQGCWGTNVSVSKVHIDGGPTLTPDPTANRGIESDLDVETVAGLAPGSTIRVYQGPDAQLASTTMANVLDTYQAMVNEDVAQVLESSWGECALGLNQSDPTAAGSEANIFAEAAAQGQSMLVASGDKGSTDCFGEGFVNSQGNKLDPQLSVDDPAQQVNVTAVGGTSLIGNGSSPATQSTWNTPQHQVTLSNGTVVTVPGIATGGGVSQFTQLSGTGNYQQGFTGPGYFNACTAATGATCRQVPDVAALADPTEGYLITCQTLADGSENVCIVGGTSGAAPLWAAITALADSGMACAANGPAGFLNPALYANASHERDVTTGSNYLPDSGYAGQLYSAGTGYDLTTGLGSPNAAKVVEDVCGAKGAAPGSNYEPMTPSRIMDTGAGGLGGNSVRQLQIEGANGIPATNVTAVVLNVTAVNPSAASYLTVYPDGGARPGSSSLNFSSGETIPNLVTVQVGTDGFIDFYNHVGSVQVLADLQGYYTSNTSVAGSTYHPVTPTRILNATPLGTNSNRSLQILGQGGVPTSASASVSAVILNVTVTNPTDNGYVSVYPDGVAQPVVSNLNFTPGETIPNLVIVPVGGDGKVNIYNHFGTTTVLADVEGYYTPDQTGLKFHASAPHRLLDTRNGNGVAVGQVTPIGQNATFGLPVDDVNGDGNKGPLATSGGLVLNVVVTNPTASSYLKVFPVSAGSPVVSNLNYTAGETIPNAVMTPVGGDFIDFYNHVGSVDAVVDLFGYFAAS